jgi:hypothetical protein
MLGSADGLFGDRGETNIVCLSNVDDVILVHCIFFWEFYDKLRLHGGVGS